MTRTPAALRAIGSQRTARWLAATFALAVLASPRIGWACSVCSAGRDEANRVAFIATTAFMTFLPLLMIGGVVWWLVRRVRQHGSRAALDTAAQRAPRATSPARAAEA
ncbi:MAG TPA: hypothetical protein VIY27_03170 [Myxococcota bacterium]